jgi:hypothetical protein
MRFFGPLWMPCSFAARTMQYNQLAIADFAGYRSACIRHNKLRTSAPAVGTLERIQHMLSFGAIGNSVIRHPALRLCTLPVLNHKTTIYQVEETVPVRRLSYHTHAQAV